MIPNAAEATLTAALLTLLLACASPPPTLPDEAGPQQPDADATARPQTAPEGVRRGSLVAARDEDLQEGERLEQAARLYQAELELMFQQLRTELDGCYLPQLKREPALKGMIVVEFTVVQGGVIGEGPVVSFDGLESEEVNRCILELVKSQTYPEPFNGQFAQVKRTFQFGAF